MKEATQAVATHNRPGSANRPGRGRELLQTLMGPCHVVVVDELPHHMLEVATPKDEVVIQCLPALGANPSLSECVCPRRLEGEGNDLGALGLEDHVEASGELCVPVVKEEPGRQVAILDLPGQVPGLLLDPAPVRMVGAAGEMDASGTYLDEEEDIELGQPDGVNDKEVCRQQDVRMFTQELLP